MAQRYTLPCSPYLLQELRELWVACAEISQARGLARTPCASCSLADTCRGPDLANVTRLRRRRPAIADRPAVCPPAHAA